MTQPTIRDRAIDLVDRNLAALPHPEFGRINMLPFAHESDMVRKMRHNVAEAIIGLLVDAGMLKDDTAESTPVATQLTVRCVACGGELCTITVDGSDGEVANTNARNFIASVSSINPKCETGHRAITPEDVREHLEEQFYSDPETRRAMECPVCQAEPGQPCRKVKGHQTHNGMHDERGQQR